MFNKLSGEGYISNLKDTEQKTLVYGDKTLMVEFKFKKGSVLPKHSHPYEQTGYLISGHMILSIDGKTYDVHPGDSWCILDGLQHSAEAIEDTIAVEVFAPVREDYLPQKTYEEMTK
ncbi:cupin 2 domain-containing protein [Clostridium aceticum]|uniref:Cupin 2 domain-containing protein n=1 Tax=Clostridium aceticum TaxID=84022 RepID=A0A0D8IBY5_9CLOT|nr:cupin domain-containing protein [Clostridium aceticum]AKL94875.1 cupin 2 domain-containing protein [Clostridium aceticum]KJF27803.1 cupin [Clostridium aceticum]